MPGAGTRGCAGVRAAPGARQAEAGERARGCRQLCSASVFAHVRPGRVEAGGGCVCTEVTCAWGGGCGCAGVEVCEVPGVAPVWSQGARESHHLPCMSWGARRVPPQGCSGGYTWRDLARGHGNQWHLCQGSLLPAGWWGLDRYL